MSEQDLRKIANQTFLVNIGLQDWGYIPQAERSEIHFVQKNKGKYLYWKLGDNAKFEITRWKFNRVEAEALQYMLTRKTKWSKITRFESCI